MPGSAGKKGTGRNREKPAVLSANKSKSVAAHGDQEAAITGRRRIEESLLQSEERFRTSVENMLDAFGIYTAIRDRSGKIQDFKIEYVNAAACVSNRMSKEAQLGKRLCELLPSNLKTGLFDNYCRVVETGEPLKVESQIYEDVYGGERLARIFDIHAVKLGDGFAAAWRDITERRRDEQALKDNEKRVKMKLDAILSPQEDIGKLQLEDILDVQDIQAIMDDFYKLTNVSAWILDLKGKILVSTGWRDICTQFHRANSETCKNCIESDTRLSEGVAPGTFKIYKCKNNMWDLVTPIIVGGKHVGNLFLGQFLFDDETVDYESFRSQARQYGFNEAEYLAALERVPRWSRDTVNTSMDFYSKFAHMISSLSHSNIALARSLTEKNSLLADRNLAQTALKESEEKYRTLFNKAPVGIALTTIEGTVVDLNTAQAKIVGYTVEELLGKNAAEYYVNPDQRKEMIETFRKTGKLRDFETELRGKDGSIIIELLNFDQVQIGGGHFIFVTGRDITGLRQAEKSMRESEAQYRLLAEHTTDFIVLMDMNLNPTYQSPSAEKHTGLTHKELMELPMEKRIAPESLKVAAEMFLEEIPRIQADPDYNPIRTLELEIYRADGTTLWSENKFSVIRDANRNPISILGEARDITKRKEAEKKLEQTLAALEKTMSDTVIAISKMVEMKDPFTAGHQIRVAQLAVAMAKKMDLTDEQVTHVNTAATIHDIGKIYVPSDILSKPGNLGALEYQIIQTHVQGSYDILKQIDFSGPIAQIVYQHHERMDGSGYPRGLKGSEILPEAKILIVADVVEAMSSHRPYRAAMGIDKALEEITNNKGIKYDEACVDACLELFREGQFEFKSV